MGAGQKIFLWVLLLGTAIPFSVFGETLEERLPKETFQKLMKAVILAESVHRRKPGVNLRPMTPDCALMQCGKVQEELVYLLGRQKFPEDSMTLVQMNQWFGKHSLAHAALMVTVKDKKGKPMRLMLDPTFVQFADTSEKWDGDMGFLAVLPLSTTEEGRSMFAELSRYGMYEITDPRLLLLNSAMTRDGKGRPRVLKFYEVEDLFPADYHDESLEKAMTRPFRIENYLTGVSIELALNALTEVEIQQRIQNGAVQQSTILRDCDRYLRDIAPTYGAP